ncbi:MAG TPA: cytochrome c maturation protein CcmE [Gaiellaceae bacterium]
MPTRSPARLVVALGVAAVLAIFLVYTAIAGGSTPELTPSQLHGKTGKMSIVGVVLAPVRGDSHSGRGLRFRLADPKGGTPARVDVVYHGTTPPPLFQAGRSVVVSGTYNGGRLDGTDILTKCPSKYTSTTTPAG